MDKKRATYRRSLIGPVILIGLGVVFLLNNLGILPWSVWDVIWRLWPILLVAAGLDLLLGRRSVWGSLLALTLTLAVLAGVLWLIGSGVIRGQAADAKEISQALEGATRARVTIAPAVGSLRIDALRESNDLISGVVYPVSGEEITRDFAVAGGTATFSLRSQGSFGPFTPFVGGWGDERAWDLGLSPDVALTLESEQGVGQSEIDLTGLQVSDLDLSMGVGQIIVILPREGGLEAQIEGAIGRTVVEIPAGLAVRVQVDTGLATSHLPESYERQDDTYTSPGYASAEDRANMVISQAIGDLTVRQYRGR